MALVARLVLAAAALPAVTGCTSLAVKAEGRGGDAVTEWTIIGDYYGQGEANWRTLAVMQMAMHDALNAAHPRYARWSPAAAGEPAAEAADPEVAMAAAAAEVLVLLHPDHEAETVAALETILGRYPNGPPKISGKALGTAIGRAAVERRAQDGFNQVHFFQGSTELGRWRPTPSLFQTSRTNESRPFLFAAVGDVPALPPPAPGTPGYREGLEVAWRVGGQSSSVRTAEQTKHAYFWAYQSGQRGFVALAVRLIGAHPPPGGVYEEARLMAQLTAAMADSAILTWNEKARYSYWRPVTAIRVEGVDPAWSPLVETPPFPEYPSGHATDCYVGAGVLQGAFPQLAGPIEYVSSAYFEPLGPLASPPTTFAMGQHAQARQGDAPGGRAFLFPSFGALASDCASARIWSGAHFPAAEVESQRLADVIVRRALDGARSIVDAPLAERLPAPSDGP